MQQTSINCNTTAFDGDGGGRVVVVVECNGGGATRVVMVVKKTLFEEFFDTSLEILTPALQVVQVTNMGYDKNVHISEEELSKSLRP